MIDLDQISAYKDLVGDGKTLEALSKMKDDESNFNSAQRKKIFLLLSRLSELNDKERLGFRFDAKEKNEISYSALTILEKKELAGSNKTRKQIRILGTLLTLTILIFIAYLSWPSISNFFLGEVSVSDTTSVDTSYINLKEPSSSLSNEDESYIGGLDLPLPPSEEENKDSIPQNEEIDSPASVQPPSKPLNDPSVGSETANNNNVNSSQVETIGSDDESEIVDPGTANALPVETVEDEPIPIPIQPEVTYDECTVIVGREYRGCEIKIGDEIIYVGKSSARTYEISLPNNQERFKIEIFCEGKSDILRTWKRNKGKCLLNIY